jgi:hypothetical protein
MSIRVVIVPAETIGLFVVVTPVPVMVVVPMAVMIVVPVVVIVRVVRVPVPIPMEHRTLLLRRPAQSTRPRPRRDHGP